MFTAILLIVILSILVLVHEFGHFYTARKMGIRVEEFGWGLPPRAWGKKIGETIYSINWLPFGGFVKLTGEDFDEASSKDPKSFASKKPKQKLLVLLAGVSMNILFAVFIYYIMFAFTGYKTSNLPLFFDHTFRFGSKNSINTTVMGFSEASPAEEAGIEVGEAIIEVNSVPVYSVPDVRSELKEREGLETKLLLMDVRPFKPTFRSVTLNPTVDDDGEAIIGVVLVEAFSLDYGSNKLFSAPMHSYNMISYSASSLYKLGAEAFAIKDISPVSESVAGPVGIFTLVKGILSYSGVELFVKILDLTALLSLSLALLNILPFPALDGGRAFFVVVELVSGKKTNAKFEGAVHRWGMLALLALIVLVTINDIKNLF